MGHDKNTRMNTSMKFKMLRNVLPFFFTALLILLLYSYSMLTALISLQACCFSRKQEAGGGQLLFMPFHACFCPVLKRDIIQLLFQLLNFIQLLRQYAAISFLQAFFQRGRFLFIFIALF